jgi:hypothetical protein
MPFHTPSSGHRPAEHRFAPFRKKDKVVAFVGAIFVLIGLGIAYPFATQQYQTSRMVLVFFMGLFGGLIVIGIFSALAELSYLIFKYPKDWNSLGTTEKQENDEKPLSQN